MPATADKRAMENHDSFPKHCRTNESQQSRIFAKGGCSDRRIQPRKASIGRTETSPIHALFASHWKSANKGTPKHQASGQAMTNSEPSNKIARQKNDESCPKLPPFPLSDSSTTSLREQNLPRFRGKTQDAGKDANNPLRDGNRPPCLPTANRLSHFQVLQPRFHPLPFLKLQQKLPLKNGLSA